MVTVVQESNAEIVAKLMLYYSCALIVDDTYLQSMYGMVMNCPKWLSIDRDQRTLPKIPSKNAKQAILCKKMMAGLAIRMKYEMDPWISRWLSHDDFIEKSGLKQILIPKKKPL